MRNKLILGILLVAMLVLAGCEGLTWPPWGSGSSTNVDGISYVGGNGIEEIEEGFGIYGSEVKFDGVYPGWNGTVPLVIINGNDRDRLFVISVRETSKPKEGYEAFPEEYFYWITISETEVNVYAGDTCEIPITLTMPSDSDYKSKKAEVRIRVEDTTQTGLVQIALEVKWFIITAG